MTKYFRVIALLASLIASTQFAAAATYYVSASTGNDSWSGLLPAPTSTDGPFRTLQKAKTAMEGSFIKTTTVRAGTYSIAGGAWAFTIADNGEAWVPYANESPVIDGGSSGYITLTNVTTFTFEGFHLQNMPGGITRDGDIIATGGSHYTFRWNTFTACKGFCISMNNVSSSIMDSNTVNGQSPATFNSVAGTSYAALAVGSGGSGNTISHNFIQNAEGGGIASRRGSSDPVSGVVIDRNILKNVVNGGASSFYHDFAGIYVYDATQAVSTFSITNNKIFGSYGPNFPTNAMHAIYLDEATSGVSITGNIINQGGSSAIFLSNGGKNNIAQNNIVDVSPSHGDHIGTYQLFNAGTDTDMSGNQFINNIVFSSSTFLASSLWVEISNPPNPLTVDTNDYFSATGATIPPLCSGCSPAMTNVNSKNCNPGFANPAGNDYTITNPTCTAQISWVPLATDQGPIANPFNGATTVSGKTYHYVVTGVNSAGESGPSNEATVTIPIP